MLLLKEPYMDEPFIFKPRKVDPYKGLTNPEKIFVKAMKVEPVMITRNLFDDNKLCFPRPQTNFTGYGIDRRCNQFYKTTNSEYGFRPPNDYTIPRRFFGNKHELTSTLTDFSPHMGLRYTLNLLKKPNRYIRLATKKH
ncbi:uncharacterized protein LOC119679006 [Teleopsis dalmanni]|uniref:uncharacterized protein LOC119679005 n=1 Tax=Teleopsis dalmanni TaxID=139649 RepID=UPI0018CF389E|nr:uncharacterized protein LOC119679005 [Teleopsis dalmanni]XP_037947072.1 uncharacterized protein LOC119679006 [Teleopsis dalmanni]